MEYCIYTVYHKKSQLSYMMCIDKHREWYDVNVDKGLNYLNPVWSEMVAMWWVWKNGQRTKYVGFNHYRRQFEVRRMPKEGECQIYTTYDFGRPIYEQYASSHRHEDMDDVLMLLDKRYGKGNAYSQHIRTSNTMIGNCCYFTRWEDFNRLCEFLFGIIDEYSALTGCYNDISRWRQKAEHDFGGKDTEYQMRVVSFLAERLISAWITTHMQTYRQKDVLIVHYNTPEVTEACIKSLFKHTPDCNVFIFDNSNKRPFTKKIRNVRIIDNTKGKYINLQRMLDSFPNKVDETINNWASAQHCYTIDYCCDILPAGFVLMDSDILLKRDISFMWDVQKAWVGMPYCNRNRMITFVERLLPFLCWINVPKMRESHIRYFDGRRMWKLRREFPWKFYDTGAVFYKDCQSKGLQGRRINIFDYMIHFGSASFAKTHEASMKWLEDNSELWK